MSVYKMPMLRHPLRPTNLFAEAIAQAVLAWKQAPGAKSRHSLSLVLYDSLFYW
jgi:hypothetical protein